MNIPQKTLSLLAVATLLVSSSLSAVETDPVGYTTISGNAGGYVVTLPLVNSPVFEGAVNAQLKKQTRGIDYLEKRLLKAQKKKLSDHIQRLSILHNHLFPDDSLQERISNFTVFYLEMGENMIPSLIKCLDPLNPNFTLIEY